MRRRRSGILVKLFNLVYIAACGISIYALCTRPIINANVHIHFEKEKIGTILSKAFGGYSENSESTESRLVYRETRKKEIKDFITKEKVETYFPNGYDVDIPFQVTAKQAFNINNKQLVDDIIQLNLTKIVDNVYKSLDKPINNLFKTIVQEFAKDTLSEQINAQIAEYFPDGAPATDEEVQTILDNVYSLLDNDEPVTINQLAETILHGKDGDNSGVLEIINARGSKYVAWDPQPTEEEVTADLSAAEGEGQYFVRIIGYKHNTAEYKESTVYYTQVSADVFEACSPQPTAEQVEEDRTAEESAQVYFIEYASYKHNENPYDSTVTYYKATPYTSEDIDEDKIASMMTDSLEDVDGLVSRIPHICDPQPTQEEVEADIAKENQSDRVYYVLDANGDAVLPTEYSASETYYTVEKVVNDIDTAMAALIDSFLNGGGNQNRGVTRTDEAVEASSEPKSISENIRDYLYKMIPQNVSSKIGVVGEKAPFILLALIALFALPWAWFALVTLIRTIRPSKFWTRPMIVLFWGFPQLIFGIGLTYGTNYIFSGLARRINAISEYANSFNFNLRTGCLIPSFVYLGVAAMTLVYWVIRRPIKVQHKLEQHFSSRMPLPPRQPRAPKWQRPKRRRGEPRIPNPDYLDLLREQGVSKPKRKLGEPRVPNPAYLYLLEEQGTNRPKRKRGEPRKPRAVL